MKQLINPLPVLKSYRGTYMQELFVRAGKRWSGALAANTVASVTLPQDSEAVMIQGKPDQRIFYTLDGTDPVIPTGAFTATNVHEALPQFGVCFDYQADEVTLKMICAAANPVIVTAWRLGAP